MYHKKKRHSAIPARIIPGILLEDAEGAYGKHCPNRKLQCWVEDGIDLRNLELGHSKNHRPKYKNLNREHNGSKISLKNGNEIPFSKL